MSRIALASIPSLTLYKDALTTGRRTRPIPQLICEGAPCKQYTPDVVRCENVGGSGTDVDWSCKAELPSLLKLGRVEVSCEGYSGPQDPYVLKGSCSLKYRLVKIPSNLGGEPHMRSSRVSDSDPAGIIFMILFLAVLGFILWGFFKSLTASRQDRARPGPPRHGGGGGGGNSYGPTGGWFPGAGAHGTDPPPPYSKYGGSQSPPAGANQGWRPGFWTGTALGGLGAYLLNERNRQQPRTASQYDWEREREARRDDERRFAARRRPVFHDEDRGEGPSNLGRMRESTGFGGSSVR